MSRAAFDYLTESPFWSVDNTTPFDGLSDDTLREALAEYREYILSQSIAKTSDLGVTLSAQLEHDDAEIKASVLYFDDVLVPDPLFELSERTRDRPTLPWETRELTRVDLATAARRMKALAPLVSLGRVRFIPSTHVLEPPEKVGILVPDDSFEEAVPTELKEWFAHRARVRKVVHDNEKHARYVLSRGPDSETYSINIDFGQDGPQAAYDYFSAVPMENGRLVLGTPAPPPTPELMAQWLRQSTNASAGMFLSAVLADAGVAWKLGSAFVTSCPVTAELLERVRLPVRPDKVAEAALSLRLPIVENASISQLAELIAEDSGAFESFRTELRYAADTLAQIDTSEGQRAAAEEIATRLTREQILEVDRKLRETKWTKKYNVPVTVAILGAGGFGLAAAGLTFVSGVGAFLAAAAAVGSTLKDTRAHRSMPGYFLWKLRSNTKGE